MKKLRHSLVRGLGFWELTFDGHHAVLKHEQGLLYVAHLLANPPEKPIHGSTLVSRVAGATQKPSDLNTSLIQKALGSEDAGIMQNLRARQSELQAIMNKAAQPAAVKTAARRDVRAITNFLRKGSWRTRDNAARCVRSVSAAIVRLHHRLARAVDAQGNPHPVLRPFAAHLKEFLLIPSGRAGQRGGPRRTRLFPGCFTYDPPPGTTWLI